MSKILLCTLAILLLFPILWMIVGSFLPVGMVLLVPPRIPRVLSIEYYRIIFSRVPILLWLANSMIVMSTIFIAAITVTALGAYAFITMQFRGKRFLYWFFVSGLMIPLPCLLLPRYIVARYIGGLNNWWGIIAMSIYAPGALILLRQCFAAIPKDFYEAARMDGASDATILARIVLPQSTAVLAYLALTQFLGSIMDFAWPMLVLNERRLFTLPLGILYFLSNYTSAYLPAGAPSGPNILAGLDLAGGVLLFLPALLIFAIFRNVLNKRFLEGGLKE